MKILVTGGAGYIGSHTVVELHNAGHDVVIVDNFSNSSKDVLSGLRGITGKDFPVYEVDCLDFDALKSVFEKENFDGVIHFAALKAVGESSEKPLEYYENNLMGLINVMKIMRIFDVHNLIFSSSACVYGVPAELPVTEDTPRSEAESPYGNTKKISEDIIKDVVRVTNLKSIILRYFNPIGAHESGLIGELPIGKPNNLVPFITQSAAGIRGPLVVFGNNFDTPDGYQIRDFIHVVDLANAHVRAIEYLNQKDSGFVDVFNIGTGRGSSNLEVINSFQKVSGGKLKYEIGAPRKGDVVQIWADVSKAESKLGWKAGKTLEDSMRDAWNWQKKLSKID